MTRERYITFFQGNLNGGQSKRTYYVAKKGAVLKGVLITGNDVEISLSINSRTEVFIAGQNGIKTTKIAPDKRMIRFDEPLHQSNIYGVIERKGQGYYALNNAGVSLYLIVEEKI